MGSDYNYGQYSRYALQSIFRNYWGGFILQNGIYRYGCSGFKFNGNTNGFRFGKLGDINFKNFRRLGFINANANRKNDIQADARNVCESVWIRIIFIK